LEGFVVFAVVVLWLFGLVGYLRFGSGVRRSAFWLFDFLVLLILVLAVGVRRLEFCFFEF